MTNIEAFPACRNPLTDSDLGALPIFAQENGMELFKILERERQKIITATNFLEALAASLSRNSGAAPLLSVVATASFPDNRAEQIRP